MSFGFFGRRLEIDHPALIVQAVDKSPHAHARDRSRHRELHGFGFDLRTGFVKVLQGECFAHLLQVRGFFVLAELGGERWLAARKPGGVLASDHQLPCFVEDRLDAGRGEIALGFDLLFEVGVDGGMDRGAHGERARGRIGQMEHVAGEPFEGAGEETGSTGGR